MFAIFRQCCRRAIDNRREIVLVAIGQAPERTSILEACLDGIDITVRCREAFRMDCQISLIDGQIALRVDDFVVDTCITHEADIFHIDGIRIRIFVGISRRTSSLVVSIETAGLNGQVIRAVIQLIAIDNRLARHAFPVAGERCGERPVVDGRIAIGLLAAAVDVDLASEDLDGAAILCSGIFIAARFTFVRQVVAVRSSFDVVNRIVIGFTDRCFIAARTRCVLCPAFARERAAASVVVGYVAFVEGIRISVDVMLFVILSSKSCFCGGLDIVIRQFLAVDFRHVVSGDIDGRLYLEDVLVAVVLTCRIRSARRTPLCVRAAVEVRAELIGIWRVGIDLPVAARAGRDSRSICRGQVLEGTICTACIDDNGIVFRRLSVQCTIIIGVIQDDCTVLTRRRQVDLFASLDAIDIDVARSLDINTIIDGGNAVAYGDVCSMNRNTFIRTNLTSVRSASSRSSATNGHVASRIDCEVFQAHRQSSIALQIHLTAASLYFKTRMSQILLLDKSLCRSGRSSNIVPVRSDTITYCYIWTAVIRLCRRGMRSLRVSFMPFSIIVLQWSTAVICKLRAFAAGGLTFRSSNPIITLAMFGICRINRITTAFTAYEERNLTSRCCKRILKRRSNRCQIRIIYSRTAASTILSQPFRRFPRIRNTLGHIRFVSCI